MFRHNGGGICYGIKRKKSTDISNNLDDLKAMLAEWKKINLKRSYTESYMILFTYHFQNDKIYNNGKQISCCYGLDMPGQRGLAPLLRGNTKE